MENLKIGVYQICKNEEQFVLRWYNSIKQEQDGIFITDTGSTDGTLKLLKSLPGVTVFEQKVIPWRFDTQRNISLQNVPVDYDVLLCLDLDETMEPGWRKKIEEHWQPQFHFLVYRRIQPKEYGDYEISDCSEKIHCRHKVSWYFPIHEYLVYENNEEKSISISVDDIICYHYPDKLKNKHYIHQKIEEYLKLDEFKPYEKKLYYLLAAEYKKNNMYDKIREQYFKYLQITYEQDSSKLDFNTQISRILSMHNIQKSIIDEKDINKLTDIDVSMQLQWILKQTGEYLYYLENWIMQQKLWKMIGNYVMIWACCDFQISLFENDNRYLYLLKAENGYKPFPIDEIRMLKEEQCKKIKI